MYRKRQRSALIVLLGILYMPGAAVSQNAPQMDELLREFAQCEAKHQSFAECLTDVPSPPALASLSDESRSKLSACLGSKDLAQSQDLLALCLQKMQSGSVSR